MSEITLTAQQYASKYNSLRQKINFPFKIELYFSLMESTLSGQLVTKNIQQSQSFSPLLLAGFSKMSELEKSYFLFSNMEYMKKQQEKFQENSNEPKTNIKKNISVNGQISETIVGLTYWKGVHVDFLAEKKQLRISGKKDTSLVDLRLYLMRKSKRYKNTMVLEGIEDGIMSDQKKIMIFFKSSIFNFIYAEIFRTILEYRNEQILKMVLEEINTQEPNNLELSLISKKHQALMFLNSKNVNDYINYKDSVLKKLLTSNFHFKPIYKMNDCTIDQSQKHPNYYKLETIFDCAPELLREEFLSKYQDQSFTFLMQTQTLETFSQKYSAIYAKHVFSQNQVNKIFEHIFVQEKSNKSLEEVLFLRGIDNLMMKKSIEFILVKVKQITSDRSKLVVVGSFTKNAKTPGKILKQKEKFNTELIIMFLAEFSDMLFRKDEVEHLSHLLVGREISQVPNPHEEFRTVQGNFEKTLYKEEVVEEYEEEEQVTSNTPENSVDIPIKTQLQPLKQDTYHSHRYTFQTLPPLTPKDLVTQHFLFSEWNRKFAGGIVCKDTSAINEQKKVGKYILKTLGKNVIQNKGLLNLSLPVNIFKPQSHLDSVARNFSFAPILLEKAADLPHLEKMKYCIIFALSVSSLSISVSKPFNPILGQTLQVWIDGCPMYLEQISHHPPIVSYYLMGRGFKAYGSITTKASFGLNTIYGYSDKPNYVLFDDGTEIEVSFAKMAIKGILFGEREFNFIEKIYAFDPAHRIFSTLLFGDQSKGLFTTNNNPSDSFEGSIAEVTEEFRNSFLSKAEATYPSSKHIEQKLSSFEGVWNGRVFFDSEEYIDFSRENPCKVKKQQFPLPSNSSYREDIIQLQLGNLEASQAAKEELEEIQRRDRYLRAKLGPKQ